jgi:hypothetical protein
MKILAKVFVEELESLFSAVPAAISIEPEKNNIQILNVYILKYMLNPSLTLE